MVKQILLKLKKPPAKKNVLPSFRQLETLKEKKFILKILKEIKVGKKKESIDA